MAYRPWNFTRAQPAAETAVCIRMADNYVIAVRTYKRAAHFQRNTLKMLREQGLEDRLYVFVGGDDLEVYKSLEPSLRYLSAPVGGCQAIRAICDYFPRGQPIVFMDDDLADFCIYDSDTDSFKRTGLGDVILEGFTHAPFSFGFLRNKLWLRRQKRFRPQYGCMFGCFFGAYNVPELITTTHGHLDDTLRTIQYLKTGTVPWVFPGASFITRYGRTDGGLQASGDRADTRKVCEEVEPQVREFCTEIVLHDEGPWAWKWKSPTAVKRVVSSLSH